MDRKQTWVPQRLEDEVRRSDTRMVRILAGPPLI
jgi:hypothetical protein